MDLQIRQLSSNVSVRHPSSFRDPSGFLFYHNNILYRQVNRSFKKDFDLFINSGLYDHLVGEKILIPHQTIDENLLQSPEWYQTLQPERVPFISYPYEWSFEMWKDAALLTLRAATEALQSGMMLKDASAYNVQWHNGRMTFIDTLSFEAYEEGKPWIAYRQFCEHFLAPLALMHFCKIPLQKLFVAYPDGIPLKIASSMLSFKSRLHLHTFLHIHLHAKAGTKKAQKQTKTFSRKSLLQILESLTAAINSYQLKQDSGVWANYYKEAEERADYLLVKKRIIDEWLQEVPVVTAVDLGANNGLFSETLANKNIYTISADADHGAVNDLYLRVRSAASNHIHPLIVDLANPSPAVGANNKERMSFLQRIQTELVLALALIHHLCIGKNMPFEDVAEMTAGCGKYLLIEFVPKADDKVQMMINAKRDVYDWYRVENFEKAFLKKYSILKKEEIGASKRILYLMERHEEQPD